jgi:hypothetical protein
MKRKLTLLAAIAAIVTGSAFAGGSLDVMIQNLRDRQRMEREGQNTTVAVRTNRGVGRDAQVRLDLPGTGAKWGFYGGGKQFGAP